VQLINSTGSPPHTRGESAYKIIIFTDLGITPAYAGRIPERKWYYDYYANHPRIRGENSKLSGSASIISGSPPHTRGESKKVVEYIERPGITPAYAGRIAYFGFDRWTARDHPRIRGENLSSSEYPKRFWGSPPHTRGECQCPTNRSQGAGITPAYAGRIQQRSFRVVPVRDHPRIRGENHFSTFLLESCRGSPPHTRGELGFAL